MKQTLDHWKEAVGVLLYFGFLAYFTPKARALGWGMEGTMFCVLAGALLIGLLYLLVKCISSYIEDHREEVATYREYMGLGSSIPHVELAATADGYTDAELDEQLANNPYASPELFDDARYTRLLPSVDESDEEQEARLVEELEEAELPGGKVAAIIGENPRRRLDLADNFQPDAEGPLATGVLFIAMPGGGKTVAMVRFLEQYILLFRLACVLFCLEGDLRSILSLCPRGLLVGPTDLPSMAYVLAHRVQLVVDLQQCRKPGEQFVNYEMAGQLISRIVKDMLNAQAALKAESQETPLPCLLALDELQMWTPQTPPSYLSGTTYKDLLDTLTVVATRGRKYSVVPFLAAQRIAKVHKDIIAGCETRVLGKTDLDTDLTRYREYVGKEVISDQGIRSLSKGHMIVCMNGKRVLVQFKNRQSRHTSHSPHLTGALNTPVEHIPPDILAAGASASRPVAAALSYEPMRNGSQSPVVAEQSRRPGGLPRPLQQALDAYVPGMTYRDLGAALGCSVAEARSLWQELQKRGILQALARPAATSPAPPESHLPAQSILHLPDYRRKEQRIPTLQEVMQAFPDHLPSKREIVKRFSITEHQAYKLYRELEQLGGRSGGRVDEKREAAK